MPTCSNGTFLYKVRPGDTAWLIARRYNTTVGAIAAANPGVDLNKLSIGQPLCILAGYHPSGASHPAPGVITKPMEDLNNTIRMLWEQHVVWTRLTILSMVFDLPDVDLVTNRLLKNPMDFANVLRPQYGDNIASRFADLFKDHLVIASQLVTTAKAGDNAAAADAEKRWYANANEIAAFLGSINPYWSERDWRMMLHEHLSLTKSEAVDMLTKNYAQGISRFDEIEKQALRMADMMTSGITRQFPDNFR